jgi:hypothetical protein
MIESIMAVVDGMMESERDALRKALPMKYLDYFWEPKFAWYPTLVLRTPPHPWKSEQFWEWGHCKYRVVWLRRYLKRRYITYGAETDTIRVELTDGLDCSVRQQ